MDTDKERDMYKRTLEAIAYATPLPGPGGEREARLAMQEWAKAALLDAVKE